MFERVPPLDNVRSLRPHRHAVAARQTLYAGKQGVRSAFLAYDIPQSFGKHLLIQASAAPGELPESFKFRREPERAIHVGIVQGLDAEAVARKEKPLVARIPNREGPHAVEAQLAFRSPLGISGEHDFTIRFGNKAVPELTETFAQLDEVVNFAIEGKPVTPIGVRHWLPAAIRHIEDGQPAMAQPEAIGGKVLEAAPVGPAVRKAIRESAKFVRARSPARVSPISCNSTHNVSVISYFETVPSSSSIDDGNEDS